MTIRQVQKKLSHYPYFSVLNENKKRRQLNSDWARTPGNKTIILAN